MLTTYNIVGKEVGVPEGDKNGEEPVKDDDTEDKKVQNQSTFNINEFIRDQYCAESNRNCY